MLEDMRIALVHDYWVGLRGGEQIFLALKRLFPAADCYALVGGASYMPHDIDLPNVQISSMRYIPFSGRYYRALLPVYPFAARSLDLTNYDLVISSSSGFCHAARIAGPHLCYCHTPNRYAWQEYDTTLAAQPSQLRRTVLRRVLSYVRRSDYRAAQKVTCYVANSTAVQSRIERYYHRSSEIVYPFVDIHGFHPTPTGRQASQTYYLTVSQLLPYKRVDLAVEACTRLGAPLVVVGRGPELERLQRVAGPKVHFAGRVSNNELARLYAECTALLQCGEEDFGLAALEAQASGRPVIAFGASGAQDTIKDGITGKLFSQQSVDAVVTELQHFAPDQFDSVVIRAHAEQFDESRFQRGIMREVRRVITIRADTEDDF
jgi:glycosyltransferase involved in cell wall biosynthesis